ncbi:MAG: RnfABCDGE type electron transport complex subunit D [Pseudomonadota bacterium]
MIPLRRPRSTVALLWLTTALLLPGALVQSWLFGGAVLTLLIAGILFATGAEALCQWLRHRRLDRRRLADGSSALTGALIALCLPPETPLPVLAFACLVGLGLGKFAYGGLGNNLFNPAMVGYAAVLISFPEQIAQWPVAAGEVLTATDALTGATPLDAFSHRGALTVAEFRDTAAHGQFAGAGWEHINLAFLGGGAALLALRIAHWRVPVAVLLALALCATLTDDGGSSASTGTALFHLFTGATCLTAFFIATDPVTQPSDPRGQWLFGALIGVLIFAIRSYGTWADGAAFAVLLANGATPLLQAQGERWRARLQALRNS